MGIACENGNKGQRDMNITSGEKNTQVRTVALKQWSVNMQYNQNGTIRTITIDLLDQLNVSETLIQQIR